MSNKRNPIHIFIQAKGGVGKSVGSAILAQYLDDCVGAENTYFLDTDPSNNSFSKFEALDVEYINPAITDAQTGETVVDAMAINKIFENLFAIPEHTVVDTGSSNYIALKSYLVGNQIFEMLANEDEVKRDVFLHVPVNGGADFVFCGTELREMANQFAHVKFVIWLNPRGGEILTSDGISFDDDKMASDLRKAGKLAGIVHMPDLKDPKKSVFAEALKAGMTFKEYDGNGKYSLIQRSNIKQIRSLYYAELDDVFNGYADMRQKRNDGSKVE